MAVIYQKPSPIAQALGGIGGMLGQAMFGQMLGPMFGGGTFGNIMSGALGGAAGNLLGNSLMGGGGGVAGGNVPANSPLAQAFRNMQGSSSGPDPLDVPSPTQMSEYPTYWDLQLRDFMNR